MMQQFFMFPSFYTPNTWFIKNDIVSLETNLKNLRIAQERFQSYTSWLVATCSSPLRYIPVLKRRHAVKNLENTKLKP